MEKLNDDIKNNEYLNGSYLDVTDPEICVQIYGIVATSLMDKHAQVKYKQITIRPKVAWYTGTVHRARGEETM